MGDELNNGSALIIDNVSPEDTNIYTCTVAYNMSKEFRHHVAVVAIPTYRLTITVVLNASAHCDPADMDILNTYYPLALKDLLCNDQLHMCRLAVETTQCIHLVCNFYDISLIIT